MELEGKRAVIIGASGGIGRVLSMALALEGVEVALVGRRKPVLSALKDKISQNGGKAYVYTADVTKEKEVAGLVRKISKRFNKLDVLVNAAGIGAYKGLEKIDFNEWRKSFAVNVDGVFLASQKFLPLLKKSDKAYVLSFGSGMGKIGVAERSPYCASKFALRGLMLSLAKEFKKSNVNFRLLTLGSVLTSFGPLSLEEKLAKQKEGKKYLEPTRLASTIIAKIKNDSLEEETSLYPSDYFKESKAGKT